MASHSYPLPLTLNPPLPPVSGTQGHPSAGRLRESLPGSLFWPYFALRTQFSWNTPSSFISHSSGTGRGWRLFAGGREIRLAPEVGRVLQGGSGSFRERKHRMPWSWSGEHSASGLGSGLSRQGARGSEVGPCLPTPCSGHSFPQDIPRKEGAVSSSFPFPEMTTRRHSSIHPLPCHLLSPHHIRQSTSSPSLPTQVANTCPGAHCFLYHPLPCD